MYADVSQIPVVVHTLDIGSKMAVTTRTSRADTQVFSTSAAVHQTVSAVIVVEQEQISYDRDDRDQSIVSDWVSTGYFLMGKISKKITPNIGSKVPTSFSRQRVFILFADLFTA